MATRAKFEVRSVTRSKNYQCGAKGDLFTVNLQPVHDGSEENRLFFEATPTGEIELGVVGPVVAALFEIGREFYVDFTPAND